MRFLRFAFLVAMTAWVSACAGGVSCDTPQPYNAARLGEPLRVPDGMDAPVDSSVPVIPEGPVGDGRFPDGECLESPPSFYYGSKTRSVIPGEGPLKIPQPPPPEDEPEEGAVGDDAQEENASDEDVSKGDAPEED